MFRRLIVIAGIATVAASAPAMAEVAAATDSGFALHYETTTQVAADAAWAAFARPDLWWNDEHTYSGDASNLVVEPFAEGCFCETIPATISASAGSVEHMRVVYADPRGRTLRLDGALGPLQAEALTGTLTMVAEPAGDGEGTKITWDYVVGGYSRTPLTDFAPVVDTVIGEQFSRLVASLEIAGE